MIKSLMISNLAIILTDLINLDFEDALVKNTFGYLVFLYGIFKELSHKNYLSI